LSVVDVAAVEPPALVQWNRSAFGFRRQYGRRSQNRGQRRQTDHYRNEPDSHGEFLLMDEPKNDFRI
jgi:hypothetical protein